MMKTYITFGQIHKHNINGKFLDFGCVAVINHTEAGEGRKIAFELLGPKFCFSYEEKEFDCNNMKYYPRGFIELTSPHG